MFSLAFNFFFKTTSFRIFNQQITRPFIKKSFSNIPQSKNLFSTLEFKFSSPLKQNSVSYLQEQVKQILKYKGDNSMQYLQKLHELSFANAKINNISRAIELYQIIARKFEQNIEDKTSPAMGDTLKNLQVLYKRGGRIVEFIPLTLRLVEIRIKQLGQKSQQVANQYNELGVAYYHIQNFEQAMTNYSKALNIRGEIFGTESLEVIQIQNNIATLYYSQGQFLKAKKLFQQNIQKLRRLPNFSQKMIITPMTNLTAILQREDKYQQALKNYQQIVNLIQKIEKKDTYFLANIYHSMGIVCFKLNDIQKSHQYHSTSLKINSDLYTQNHPSLAENYHNLAICNQAMGNFQKAIQLYNKSIEIKQKTLGQQHPSLAQTHNNLGIVFKLMGNIPQARKQYQKAFQILKKQNSDEKSSPILGDLLINIGVTYLDEQNSIKASENFIKAEQILKKFFDQSHPKFTDLYFNKAKIQFLFTRDYSKARKYLDKSIRNQDQFSKTNPNLYIKYSMKGSCFFEQKKFQQAVEWYNKSQQFLIQKGKGTQLQIKANIALLRYQIGACYYQLKKYEQAKNCIKTGIEIFEQNFPQADETLVQLYFMEGNIEKGLKHQNSAQQSFKKANKSMQKLLNQAPGHPILLNKQEQIRKMIEVK